VSITLAQNNPALQIVAVIMVMAINAKLFRTAMPKHRDKFRMHRNHFWRT
jgi:hypothetical protein